MNCSYNSTNVASFLWRASAQQSHSAGFSQVWDVNIHHHVAMAVSLGSSMVKFATFHLQLGSNSREIFWINNQLLTKTLFTILYSFMSNSIIPFTVYDAFSVRNSINFIVNLFTFLYHGLAGSFDVQCISQTFSLSAQIFLGLKKTGFQDQCLYLLQTSV